MPNVKISGFVSPECFYITWNALHELYGLCFNLASWSLTVFFVNYNVKFLVLSVALLLDNVNPDDSHWFYMLMVL